MRFISGGLNDPPSLPGSAQFKEESGDGSAVDGECQLPERLGGWRGKETNICRMSVLSSQMFLINLCGGGYAYPHFTDKETGTQATQPVSSRAGI